VQADVAQRDGVGRQRLPGAHGHRVRARVLAQDVERLAPADPEAAPLADGVLGVAAVAAERRSRAIDDAPRPCALAAVAGEERRAPGPGEEAQVLGVGGTRHGEPGLLGQRAHVRLVQLAQREAQPGDRRRLQRREHVALVLERVGGGADQPVGRDPRVVPGRQRLRAEAIGQCDHRVEAHEAVAAHARVRRLTGGVVAHPRLHHARAKLVAQVQGEVRQPHAVRERPGAAHRAGRAARGLGVVLRRGPQLQGHGDRVRPAAQRSDRGVHAAAHRHQRAPGGERYAGVGARGRAQGAVQRVRRELRRVRLARRQPAQLGRDGVRVHARRVEQRPAAHQRHGRGARRDRRATPRGVEAGVGDGVSGD